MSIERRQKSIKPKETMLLFFEGYQTEYVYFQRIEAIRARLLGSSIHLVLQPIGRVKAKDDESHPYRVHKFMKRYKQWVKSNGVVCNYDLFLTIYLNAISVQISKSGFDLYYEDKNHGKKNPKYPNFQSYKNKLKSKLDEEHAIDEYGNVIVDVAYEIVKNEMSNIHSSDCDYSVVVEDKLRPIRADGIVHYGMVVDRDQYDFLPDQVDEIKEKCEKSGDKLIITNPNFELWLSLHTEKYKDSEMIGQIRNLLDYYEDMKNKKEGEPGKKYNRKDRDKVGPMGYLKKRYKHYKKNLKGIDFIDENGLRRAIINLQKYYKTDLDSVKKELSKEDLSPVGSNILDIILL